MNWQDEGFILSKRKFKEKCYNFRGIYKKRKVNGIVYGGTSRKVKNYLQLSNKIFLIYNSKTKTELDILKLNLLRLLHLNILTIKKNTLS